MGDNRAYSSPRACLVRAVVANSHVRSPSRSRQRTASLFQVRLFPLTAPGGSGTCDPGPDARHPFHGRCCDHKVSLIPWERSREGRDFVVRRICRKEFQSVNALHLARRHGWDSHRPVLEYKASRGRQHKALYSSAGCSASKRWTAMSRGALISLNVRRQSRRVSYWTPQCQPALAILGLGTVGIQAPSCPHPTRRPSVACRTG